MSLYFCKDSFLDADWSNCSKTVFEEKIFLSMWGTNLIGVKRRRKVIFDLYNLLMYTKCSCEFYMLDMRHVQEIYVHSFRSRIFGIKKNDFILWSFFYLFGMEMCKTVFRYSYAYLFLLKNQLKDDQYSFCFTRRLTLSRWHFLVTLYKFLFEKFICFKFKSLY